jgi:hypothetical protein
MQYPLEGLHLLMRNTLHPGKILSLYEQQKDKELLTVQIITAAGQIRMSICHYISSARNAEQAAYMIHAMNVALHDVSNTLSGYNDQLNLTITDPSLEWLTEIYALAKDQVESLLLFL